MAEPEEEEKGLREELKFGERWLGMRNGDKYDLHQGICASEPTPSSRHYRHDSITSTTATRENASGWFPRCEHVITG